MKGAGFGSHARLISKANRGGGNPIRTPARHMRGGRALGSLVLALTALWAGCSDELPPLPEESSTNIITAVYQSPEDFEQSLIVLDGVRIDQEWGSEFSPDRPFTQIRLSAENGFGNPGPPMYASMKAVYTDNHLYLLVEWTDGFPDVWQDVFIYVGPTLSEPILSCAEVGGETVCDSLYRRGCQDSLATAAWWWQGLEDDKVAITFEVDPASGAAGTYTDVGCQVACHPGAAPSFGPLASGRLDLWYWLAGRTNPIRNIFNPQDNPDDPPEGTPGYLDDMYIDRQAGILPDEGSPGYRPNFNPGSDVPRYTYRRRDDDFSDPADPSSCRNRFGELCRPNNGISPEYLWRENPRVNYAKFAACDTLNETLVPDPRLWANGDMAPGYLLTYPSGSRADVRGKGNWDGEQRIWTLEVARVLNTGIPLQDVIFEPESGSRYYFTLAIFDASSTTHWGSEPQILVFEPKTQEEENGQ